MIRFHDNLHPLLVDIQQVRQHPRNVNNGDIEAIATSIQANGMYRPVLAQSSTGHILAGNHTYAACLSLGATHIPVVWLDVDDDTALRILLADNKIAALAHVEEHALAELLQELTLTEAGLLGTGYTPEDMEALLEGADEPFLADDDPQPLTLTVTFTDAQERRELMTELHQRGFQVRASTL